MLHIIQLLLLANGMVQTRRSIHAARYTNVPHETLKINIQEHLRIYEALETADAVAAP